MNEQQFTPGPWAVNWAGSGRDGQLVYDEVYVYSPASGVEDIAVAADIADPVTGKPSLANAQLIAAAPRLLAALEALLHECTADGVSERIDRPISEEAYAAVDQAYGVSR